MQLQKYNSVVAGLHEYYCISTEVSHDFSRLAFSINKQLRNRRKGDLSKKGQDVYKRQELEKEIEIKREIEKGHPAHAYGRYQNVFLTDGELADLQLSLIHI